MAEVVPTSVSGTILKSPDGDNWSLQTGTGSGTSIYWQSYYADGKYWFSTFGDVYTTANGTAWTRLPSLAPLQPVGPVSRAPDGVNPQYLAAGPESASWVSSTNGTNWESPSPGVNAVWPRYLSVATYSNEWLVSSMGEYYTGRGTTPSDRPGNVWIPGGGQALNVQSVAGQWRRGDTDKLYADLMRTTNGVLAAGVDRNQRLFANFLTGVDYAMPSSVILPFQSRTVSKLGYKNVNVPISGINWQYANAYFAKTPNGFDLYLEAYFAAAGGSSSLAGINWGHFTSTNGSNWLLRPAGVNNVTNFPGIRGLAWGAGRFVAVSEGSSPGESAAFTSANRIYTSTDGETYFAVNLSALTPGLNGEGLTGVAFGGGKFVAIGNLGRILYSTDGLNWQTVRNSDNLRWNRVRYLNGIWVAVGNAGWVAFSTDGKNWATKTSGTESDLTDIARQNGSYMVVGSHAMVRMMPPTTPPVITLQPQSRTNLVGTLATFSITATGNAPLSYQWRKDGIDLNNETNTALSLTNIIAGDAGNYDVVITYNYDTLTSLTASLTVICPTITVNPSSLPVAPLNQPYSQNLSASGGAGTNAFSLFAGNLPMGLALSSAGVLGGTPTEGGNFNFTVIATDANGCTGVRAYNFAVSTPAYVSTPPGSYTVSPGGGATFTVIPGGTAPFTYQWRLNGVDISGANASSYNVSSANGTNAGDYTVLVCNAGGCAESSAGVLTVMSVDIYPGLLIYGRVGSTYRVDYSEDLGSPTNWITITNVVLPSSPYLFPDPTPARQVKRFYRAAKQ